MAATFTAISPTAAPGVDAVRVVGARTDRLDDDAAGLDVALLAADGFDAKVGVARLVTDADGAVCVVVGLGPAQEVGPAEVRRAAAAVAKVARRFERLVTDLPELVADDAARLAAAQSLVEGFRTGAYRFDVHRSRPKADLVSRTAAVAVAGRGGKRLQGALDRGTVLADAIDVARDLVNEPGGTLTAPVFAERAVELGEAAGLRVTVLDEDAVRADGMGGLLGVNRGSFQPPRFLEVAWEPEKPRGFVALVGKGITFDSGGLSIKSAEGMASMKDDMGGAAAVLATLLAVPTVAPRLKVVGYLPLTDNMLGSDATRVGDVLTIRNGTTVEVLNTDAEGRLVLADALSRASDDGPDAIIDIATLTGACEVALGKRTAGLMGTHDGLVDMVRAAADTVGEPVWPLPMPAHMRSELESSVADLRNIGAGRFGGTLIAAHFLAEFVGDGIPWAHLDIAGPAWSGEGEVDVPKGGTGFGVRTLSQLLATWRRPPAG